MFRSSFSAATSLSTKQCFLPLPLRTILLPRFCPSRIRRCVQLLRFGTRSTFVGLRIVFKRINRFGCGVPFDSGAPRRCSQSHLPRGSAVSQTRRHRNLLVRSICPGRTHRARFSADLSRLERERSWSRGKASCAPSATSIRQRGAEHGFRCTEHLHIEFLEAFRTGTSAEAGEESCDLGSVSASRLVVISRKNKWRDTNTRSWISVYHWRSNRRNLRPVYSYHM